MLRCLLKHRGLLLSLLLLPSAIPGAAAEKKEHSSIIVEHPYDKVHSHSIIPARVHIYNNTFGERAQSLDFFDSWRSTNIQRHLFSVPPGETREAVVYGAMGDSYFLHRITGTSSSSSNIDTSNAPLAVALQEETLSSWNLLSNSPFDAEVSRLNLMNWPADYRVYASQNLIVIPEKQYRSYLDEPHRKAIRQWVLGGGSLWLVGDTKREIAVMPLGRGTVLHAPSLEGLAEKDKKDVLSRLMENINKETLPQKIDDYYYETDIYPPLPPAASYFFTTPSFLLGLILVAFAVLAGPVCLLKWAPVGKRQRLFILIPVISLGVSLLLGAIILIGDGTGGRGSREVRILVNPQDHTGLVIQRQVCQTLIVPNNAFTLPEDAHLLASRLEQQKTTAWPEEKYNRTELENCFRQGSLCSGGWFPSRSTLEHKLVRPITTRAAVTVFMPQPGGAPVLQSTFPADLTGLVYCDPSGTYWSIGHLPPGQKKAAVRRTEPPLDAASAPVNIPPGHFQAGMAPADGELGAIPTLESINWENTHIVVSGPAAGLPQLPAQP